MTVGSDGQAALGGSSLAALSPANVLAQLKHLFGAEVAQGSSTAEIAFNVPSVSPGSYPVCAIVDGFEPGCTNFTVTGVGGASLGRGGSSGGSLTGAFASTGLALLPWLAIAAAALAIGVALKRPARQRRITSN